MKWSWGHMQNSAEQIDQDVIAVTDLLAKRVLAKCELDSYCDITQSISFTLFLKLLQAAIVTD